MTSRTNRRQSLTHNTDAPETSVLALCRELALGDALRVRTYSKDTGGRVLRLTGETDSYYRLCWHRNERDWYIWKEDARLTEGDAEYGTIVYAAEADPSHYSEWTDDDGNVTPIDEAQSTLS